MITSRSESQLFTFSWFRSGGFSPLPQDQVNANVRLTTSAMPLNLVFRIFSPWGLFILDHWPCAEGRESSPNTGPKTCNFFMVFHLLCK